MNQMVPDVLIITGSDKWLVNLVEKELCQLGLSTHVVRVSETKPETIKKLKLALIFGFFFSLRLLLQSKKRDLFPVTYCEKENLKGLILSKFVNSSVIILMNFPEKMPVLELPIYNFHPSLLPDFPGLMSIPRIALKKLNGGEAKFGSTIHLINENFDNGEIIWQSELPNQSASQSIRRAYENCYRSGAQGVKEIIKMRGSGGVVLPDIGARKENSEKMSSLSWSEVLNLILKTRVLLLRNWVRLGKT